MMSDNIKLHSWQHPPLNVRGFVTNRFGGVSLGVYQSLNLGINCGDNDNAVKENYSILKNYVGIENIVIMNQVHGNLIVEIETLPLMPPTCDGLFTCKKNVTLGVQTADCFPVLLAGKKAIAALHCGWRSLNSGIIENALTLFRQNNDFPVGSFIGPGICEKCYTIKEDMINVLQKKYKPEKYIIKRNGEIYTLNLKRFVENVLRLNEVTNIEVSPLSSCHSEGFYSYRRDNGRTGRMLSFVTMSVS